LTATYDLEIFAQPVVPTILTPGINICEGDIADVEFMAECSDGSTILWYDAAVGGNVLGSGTSYFPTNIADLAPGTYVYYVECSNGSTTCIGERAQVSLLISPTPPAPVLAANGPVCENETIELCIAAGLGDFSGATSINYTFTPLSGSTAGVSVSSFDNCITVDATQGVEWTGQYSVSYGGLGGSVYTCESALSEPVELIFNAIPEAPEPTNNGPVCEGEEVQLFANSTADTYEWTDNAGNIISILENPVLQDLAAGTYSYYLSITIDGCTSNVGPGEGETVVVVNPIPAPPVGTAYSICEGNTVSDPSTTGLLAACTATGESIAWYDAFTGGNQIGTGSPFMPSDYNDYAAGSYTFYAECTNAGGCIGERTPITLTITNGAPAPIVPSPTVCDGNNVEICFSLVQDGIAPGDIFVSPPNSSSVSSMLEVGADGCITITPEDEAYVSGTYTVTYIDANGCECSDINYVWFTPNGTMVNITGENSDILEICPAIASEHDGEYQVGVTIDGCSIFSDTYYLDIFESPVLDPEVVYELNEDCSVSDISLTANATSGVEPYTYDWVGPNGFVSTLANPTLANADASSNGTYTVVVTDFNGCSSEGAVEVITAENPQPLPVIASSGPACEGECIVLTVPVYVGSSVNYVWFTPAGVTNITGENTNELTICPVEAGVHEGTYSLGVTIDGCVLMSDEYDLDVFEQPVLEVSADLACIGSDITLMATVTNAADLSGPLTYEWTGPNGFSSNAEDPTIANATADDAGTYTVTVSALTGCVASASVDIDVYDAPPAAQIEGPSIVCEGDEFTLCTSTAADYPDAIFTYSPPNSNSTASQITATDGCITISSDDPAYVSGAWTVTYTDGDGCASEPGIPFEVLIQTAPIATADNNGPICFGDDVQLFAGIVDDATYAWYVSGETAPFSTEQNPVVTAVSANTTYVVEVTVNGCTSTAETEVILEGPIVEVTHNTPVCTGADVLLTATVTNAGDFTGLITYEWTGPNGFTSNAQNPTIANAQTFDSGTYTVVVTTTGDCQGVASAEVEVYDVLPAATIEGPEYVCLAGDLLPAESFTLCTSTFADYPGGSFYFSPPNSSSELPLILVMMLM